MADMESVVRKAMMLESHQEIGLYTIKAANLTIQEAAKRPTPKALYLSMWYEGELCCLFADSNLGKSILAVQIAAEIAARGLNVLYFDFEMSDKQFQLRYTNDDDNTLHVFPDTFFRVEINRKAMTGNFDEALLADIERVAIETQSKVLIIDNLTWLCGESEKGGDAADLMQRLMALKFKYDLSLLVIAHTPKRDMSRPITANDLAGSKKLFNFFDSVFAIGRSAKDEAIRYIKQIKCRYGAFTYGSENVIVASVEKVGAFLQFVTQGYATEKEHLKEQSEEDREALKQDVLRLKGNGMSYRDIASQLGISPSKAYRIINGK